ncbi:MAG TPA: hypothetical protein VGW40_04200 [Allosphingosinicella sp.]|nr:hypothetical protein [Allosphingosinicella sp.]
MGMSLAQWGAFSFGLILGWFLYFINRYRTGDVQFSDLATVIGAIGGAAVLNLFPVAGDLFGPYGIGLAIGFFLYFIVLLGLVGKSENFDADWFLDGRRKNPADGWGYASQTQPRPPMAQPPGLHGTNPGGGAAGGGGANP